MRADPHRASTVFVLCVGTLLTLGTRIVAEEDDRGQSRPFHSLFAHPEVTLTALGGRYVPTLHRYVRCVASFARRTPSPEEVLVYEGVLAVLRHARPDQMAMDFNYAWRHFQIVGILAKRPHFSLTEDLLDIVESHLGGLQVVGLQGGTAWSRTRHIYRSGFSAVVDRRMVQRALRWRRSPSSTLRAVAESWLRELGIRDEKSMPNPFWPYRRGALLIVDSWNGGPSPGFSLHWHPPLGKPASVDLAELITAQAALRLVEQALPRKVPTRSRGTAAAAATLMPYELDAGGAMARIIEDESLPTWMRFQALELFVTRSATYDLGLLRRLALPAVEGFSAEIMALGAVCALSRCPTKRALELLVDVVEQGHESARFQAASHLRFVAGLKVPPLVAWFDVEEQHQAEPWRSPGAWSDVARWIVDDTLRATVVRDLRDQVKRLPENWPGTRLYDLEPFFLHQHPAPWYLEQHGIPEVVLERSKGEDVFWMPHDGQTAQAR